LLNGKKVPGGTWLKENDVIQWVDPELTPPKPYHLQLTILYKDEDIALIYKPAGITVSGNQFKTIQNALVYNLEKSTKADALPWPLPVHRLDNPTSGLLLVARTKAARIKLGQAFEAKQVNKKYHAVLIGKAPESIKIDAPISDKIAHSNLKRICVLPSLKNEFLSLVELEPVTGRTHQLRIHSAAIGHPILGDKLYGTEGMILKHKGLFLSATFISFHHPITGKYLEFSTPPPEKFITRMKNENRRYLEKQNQ